MQGTVSTPGCVAFYASAALGDLDSALADLAHADTHLDAYNRFVLAPDLEAWTALRQSVSGDLATLTEVAAYSSGLTDQVPGACDLEGELLAVVLMTQAAAELECEAYLPAIRLLKEAVQAAKPVPPFFAVQLLVQLSVPGHALRCGPETSVTSPLWWRWFD